MGKLTKRVPAINKKVKLQLVPELYEMRPREPLTNDIDEELLADEKGAFIPATVSNVPLDDWTALLEKSWGAIEGTHFFYA